MMQLRKTPLLVRHRFHWCHIALPLPCVSFVQCFLVLQLAAGATTVSGAAIVAARIIGIATYVVIAAAVVTVMNSAAIIACVAATAAAVSAQAHAGAYTGTILSSILPRSTNHPAFSLLLHAGCCTIHTLGLSADHASTVHTTTFTRLK